MADSKLTGLTELAADPAQDDWLYIVDKSDTTDDAAGSSKKIEVNRLTWPDPTLKHPEGGIVGTTYALPGNIPCQLTGNTGALIADRSIAAPFYVPRNLTLTKAATMCVTGDSGKILRYGVYNANQTTGEITTLVSDIGTLSLTSSGTVESGAISVALSPGYYWSVAVTDSVTTASFRAFYSIPPGFGWSTYDLAMTNTNTYTNLWRSDTNAGESSALTSDVSSWNWSNLSASAQSGVGSLVAYQWTVP